MGEIVITHNKAIKVILRRKTSADMGSTLQQGGIGLRARAIFQRVFFSLAPAAPCKWASTREEAQEETSETKEDGVGSHCCIHLEERPNVRTQENNNNACNNTCNQIFRFKLFYLDDLLTAFEM